MNTARANSIMKAKTLKVRVFGCFGCEDGEGLYSRYQTEGGKRIFAQSQVSHDIMGAFVEYKIHRPGDTETPDA